ncbi:MAG TPA: hypothetical protein VGM26_12575 [Rhizomicrobium sp.]|jgi:hypothetical protein
MKRLMCAALALTLLGATAASARPYHGGGYDYHHGGGWHRGGDNGALIGLGVGLFALGAIAASQHDRYYDRYDYGPPPPPPPPAYGPRYGW